VLDANVTSEATLDEDATQPEKPWRCPRE